MSYIVFIISSLEALEIFYGFVIIGIAILDLYIE